MEKKVGSDTSFRAYNLVTIKSNEKLKGVIFY